MLGSPIFGNHQLSEVKGLSPKFRVSRAWVVDEIMPLIRQKQLDFGMLECQISRSFCPSKFRGRACGSLRFRVQGDAAGPSVISGFSAFKARG